VSLDPLEIRALAKIVDELDYYQILEIQPGASRAEIKEAYYRSSRAFHPDANRGLEPELLGHCEHVSKRVTEAYCVLRDPRRREAYDERLGKGAGKRIQLAEATAEHRRARKEEQQGRTPQGRQFFQLAQQEAERGNRKGAIQNLQMALTFEPGNAGFASLLSEWKSQR
jgi:DnaJ-class molecular chaperone